MKKIVFYFPILTTALIYFGFCNLHFYYKSFGIEIYSYITPTEILLSFLPLIVLTTTLIYSFLAGTLMREVVDDFFATPKSNVDQLKISEPQQPYKLRASLKT